MKDLTTREAQRSQAAPTADLDSGVGASSGSSAASLRRKWEENVELMSSSRHGVVRSD